GASKTRVRTISRSETMSAGSVFVFIRFLLQFVEIVRQSIKTFVPKLRKRTHPIVNRFELLRFEGVEPLLFRFTHIDEANQFQDAQMLRRLRLRNPQGRRNLIDGAFSLRQQSDDLSAQRFRHGVESISSSRRTCHASIIFLYRNISSDTVIIRDL